MGWNSYNAFGGMHGIPADAHQVIPGGATVCERLILETADALVSSGMRDVGYEYVHLDDRWQDPRQPRSRTGQLQADKRRFPRGIKPLADDIHDRGLRFGIYTVANVLACGGEEGDGPGGIPLTGSLGHEIDDAALFAEWGVDFLKIDWCGVDSAGNRGRAPDIFAVGNEAIGLTGRNIILSASTWGEEREYTWAPRLSHMWRTTEDLHATWDSITQTAQINSAECWRLIAGSMVGWNDPDMMHVGHSALSYDESRTHFILWALMSAPLIAGNDLRIMTEEIRELLTSPILIAIDQDPSEPATMTVCDENWLVWRRSLANGDIATAIVNNEDVARRIPEPLCSGVPDRLTAADEVTPVAPHGIRLTVL